MTQDAFVRLLDYSLMLREDTVRHFLFTIAKNLVTDYLRRYYRKQEINAFLMEEGDRKVADVESRFIADELGQLEVGRMKLLPPCRKAVYMKSRFEGKTAEDIAAELNIAKRTVERHLFLGRKEMREFMKGCI